MYNDGEFEVVAALGGYDCYEWSTCEVGRRDGELFYRYGSGCSCTSIEDESFVPFTWEEIVEVANNEVWGVSKADITEFLAEVAALMKKVGK